MVKILTKPKSAYLSTGDIFSGAPGTKKVNTKEDRRRGHRGVVNIPDSGILHHSLPEFSTK